MQWWCVTYIMVLLKYVCYRTYRCNLVILTWDGNRTLCLTDWLTDIWGVLEIWLMIYCLEVFDITCFPWLELKFHFCHRRSKVPKKEALLGTCHQPKAPDQRQSSWVLLLKAVAMCELFKDSIQALRKSSWCLAANFRLSCRWVRQPGTRHS